VAVDDAGVEVELASVVAAGRLKFVMVDMVVGRLVFVAVAGMVVPL
jgi:hypothetical protein